MGKVVNDNGVLWYVERQHLSGVWHTNRTFLGYEEKPKEETPKENKSKKTKKEGND